MPNQNNRSCSAPNSHIVVSAVFGSAFTTVYHSIPNIDCYLFSNNPDLRDEAVSKGWQFYLVTSLPLHDDVMVSSIQSKYVKFLQFLDDWEEFVSINQVTYFDHKFEVRRGHLDWILSNLRSDTDILIRETPRLKTSIYDEVFDALPQERYRRHMPATMTWIQGLVVEKMVTRHARIVNTGLIHYQFVKNARRLTDKVYQRVLELQQPECQLIWAIESQLTDTKIQNVPWDDLCPSWVAPNSHNSPSQLIEEPKDVKAKVVVGTGWWCDVAPHQWSIGGKSTRTEHFFELWYKQVMRSFYPAAIIVTDSDSPRKPRIDDKPCINWVALDHNYGHAMDISTEKIKTKYSGFTRSVLNGAMFALCCDADWFVYVEQDCLVFGPNLLQAAIANTTSDILIGKPTQNGLRGDGGVAANMMQQSLMIVRRSGLERFIGGILSAPWTDGELSPEEIMRRQFDPLENLAVDFGRSRPIDFTREHFYAQHFTEEEYLVAKRIIEETYDGRGQNLTDASNTLNQ